MSEMKNLVDTLNGIETAFEELAKFVEETRDRINAIERKIIILDNQAKYMQEGVPGDLYE
jgi:vacuolar-type H+-ATPase subunit D/Vma8